MPTANQKPSKIDLAFAIGLEPEQAVEYFVSKGYRLSWDWFDTWQGGHSTAFTVAKATQMDVLEDIRAAVEKSLRTGQSFEKFRKELEPKLMRRGWWGEDVGVNLNGQLEVAQLGSPSRLWTIYRTNLAVAHSAGRYRDQMENAEERPYWKYSAVMDIGTRPSHAQLNGFVFRYDDPFWDTHYPPCDWGCRCKVRALTPKQVADQGIEVKNSAGMLQDEQVEIARGVVKTVTRFKGYGANMAPGPGWNYNPGREGFSPTLAKYPPPLVKEYKAAIKKKGLAQRFPVKTYADISALLKEFDKENPGIFHRGFKDFDVVKSGGAAGSTNSHGTIKLLDKNIYGGPDLDLYNPAGSLKDALKKINKGEYLSFGEERSIKTLWHEVLHNRAKGWVDRRLRSPADTMYMETLNDFVARHTYPTFLKDLGGFEAFGEKLLSNGGGYDPYVNNFREILRVVGISETTALNPLADVSYNASWLGINKAMAKALASIHGKIDKESFESILDLIDKTKLDDIEGQIKLILEAAK